MTDKPRTVSRSLPCALDDERKLELGAQIAATSVEIQDIEAKISALGTAKRPLVKELKAQAKVLAKGTEDRTILCEIRERGLHVEIVRTDTGEVVEERPMTAAERQGDWLSETEQAVEKAKAEKKGKHAKAVSASQDGDEDDDEPSNVVPFGGRTAPSKKAARKPRGPGKGGKGKR